MNDLHGVVCASLNSWKGFFITPVGRTNSLVSANSRWMLCYEDCMVGVLDRDY